MHHETGDWGACSSLQDERSGPMKVNGNCIHKTQGWEWNEDSASLELYVSSLPIGSVSPFFRFSSSCTFSDSHKEQGITYSGLVVAEFSSIFVNPES